MPDSLRRLPASATTWGANIRLYYYTGKHWGLKSLWEKRLKISQFKDVNDPFELYPFQRTNRSSRAFWNARVEELLASRFGLLCFSEDWRISLMWSHYAEKHAGLCLGFDVDGDDLRKVEYLDAPLPDPVTRGARSRGVLMAVFEKTLECKYSGWAYEREWRNRVPLGKALDGLHYARFSNELHLREVIIGPRCTLKPVDIVAAVGDPPLDVEIFAARAAFGEFEVCRHHLVDTHTSKGFRERLKQLRVLYDTDLPAEDEGLD